MVSVSKGPILLRLGDWLDLGVQGYQWHRRAQAQAVSKEDFVLLRPLPVFAAVALSALAACKRATPTTDAALQRDLDLARNQAAQASANMNIAPDEVIPAGNRSHAPLPRAEKVRRSAAPVRTPAVSVSRPTVAAATRAPVATHDTAVAVAPATQRPSAEGAISAPPPGGYKTMGELIRKAPFPINP